nr:DNA polymerase Y family protein [Sneathiella limimaris]
MGGDRIGELVRKEEAFALVTHGVRGTRIVATNLAAEQQGVTSAQSLADARALCPKLITEEATPELDAAALERLTLWLLRYSPMVRCQTPDGLAIDITGCAHLFGGEKSMLTEILDRLRGFGLTVRGAIADTAGGAWAVARFGEKASHVIPAGQLRHALNDLSVAALNLPVDDVERLEQLGLRKISQLTEIPAASLTTRFGGALVSRLQQVLGEEADVFDPLVPPPVYQVEQSLMEPVVHLDGVQVCLERLSADLQGVLKAENKGARYFELRLFRIDGHVDRLGAGSRRLCDDAAYMQLLFTETLTRLQTDVDLGFGFDFVSLAAFGVEPMVDEQASWGVSEGSHEQSREMDRLFDRFGNRFGFDRVTRLKPRESYIPENSFEAVAVNQSQKPASWPVYGQTSLARPLLLFRPPEPVTVLAEVPDGPPLRFEWRRQLHHITRAEGPERLSPEWWQVLEVSSRQTRDYYRVEDQEGHRYWLYRDGLYDRKGDRPRWFLQGLFS